MIFVLMARRFILRALTSLGYQAQFTVLQAAEHNTPQCRRRAIIWASQLGYPLPDFPEPNNVVKTPRQYSLSWHRSRRAAAQPTVSIGDAILDLPAFDWINPHRKIPQSREQRSEREERWHKITQYECEENAKFIGRDHQSYSGEPLSGYQRKMRASVRKNELSNHVTMHWDENRTMVTEQVCNVPLRPGADHRDLPQALTHWGLTSPDSAASRNGNYPGRIGRLDTEDISGTCMTKMDPNGKFGKVSTSAIRVDFECRV
jgi:site-specific DNA-cytosine methylase